MKNGRLVQPAVESGLSIRRPGWSRRDGAGLRSAHRFLERLAGAEFRLPRRRQVDAFAGARVAPRARRPGRSEEHTSELQSLMRISYAVFCLKKKKRRRYLTKLQKQH